MKIGGSGPASSGRADLTELWSTARKILALELRSGCGDRTVIGGLEKYLEKWAGTVRNLDESSPTRAEAARVLGLLADYSHSARAERERSARAALAVADTVLESLAVSQSRQPGPVGTRPAPRSTVPISETRARGTRPPAPNVHHPAPGPEPPRPNDERPVPAPRSRRAGQAFGLDDPILSLKGVGKLKASKLSKLGLEKVRDLLTHFPRDYRDYVAVKRIADLMYGESASVVGTVEDVALFPGPQKRFRTTIKVRDASGRISATWFRYGYGGVKIPPNTEVALAGTVSGHGYSVTLESPDWEPAENPPLHTRRLVPVYPLTEGVSDYWLREVMADVVPQCAPKLPEFLPSWLLELHGLMPLGQAIAQAHFPTTRAALDLARQRLAFDELFLVQLVALARRKDWQAGGGAPLLSVAPGALQSFLASQPFALTGAQHRVVTEILGDLESARPMSRLLQGEVGSGKTVVAAVALLAAVLSGYQGALMAPTEILAEQHGRTLRSTFANAAGEIRSLLGRDLRLEVLTGSSRRQDREEIYRAAKEGEVDVLVGTQAIIQEGLDMKRLGLAIIDEQHRFGVMQRSALRQKGMAPHLLVMTATPIPRTLALTLYGDLDLSIIDELPPGRQPIKTHLLGPSEREHAYEHIRREVAFGRQGFIICPLVEDSPHLEVRAATAEYERLSAEDLAGLRLALLHGRMRPADKDQIMLDFKNGKYDVLVSTSVVEVGIDVPNATVMLIEGAERFGMAQLHQFRGRVGRGAHPSACILLTDSLEEGAFARLRTVATVTDGFRLADEDLKLRGPGEYLGVRQSGFPDFRMADLRDIKLIEKAREAAAELLRRDPDLAASEHASIAARAAALGHGGKS